MKFECSPIILRDAIKMLIPVCPIRTTLPILANVQIKADTGKLEITGTDLDVTIKTEIPADVIQGGITTIPARLLQDTISRLDSESISITVDENNIAKIVAGKKIECKLRGLSAEEFPKFPVIEEKDKIEMPIGDFGTMLKYTSYAASKNENRYVLNGVCFNFGEQFDAVATDGHRLAKYTNASIKQETAQQLIIPSKSVNMIQQMLTAEGTVFMRYSASQIEVNIGKTSLVTRLIDGQFPNYQQVIPKTYNHAIKVNRRAFLGAINLANVVNDKSKQPVVKIKITNGKMNISANTTEIGEVYDEIEVDYVGDDMDISFNPIFLTDVCQNVQTEDIVIEIVKENSPTTVKAGDDFLCVIMPMRK